MLTISKENSGGSRRVLQELRRNFDSRPSGQISNNFAGKNQTWRKEKLKTQAFAKEMFLFCFYFFAIEIISTEKRQVYKYFAKMSLFFCPANLIIFERKDTDILFKCKREQTRSQKISPHELSQKQKRYNFFLSPVSLLFFFVLGSNNFNFIDIFHQFMRFFSFSNNYKRRFFALLCH